MIKQLLLPLAGVAAFIILVGLLVKNSGNINIPGLVTPVPTATPLAKKTIKVGGTQIQVEIANTESSRELGLGGRSSLSENSGMLFVFDQKGITPGFWMKGMLIPLDLVWISGGKIVKIDKNAQPPAANTPDSSLSVYMPGQPVDYVLEVNGGFSDKNSLRTGASVDLSGI